MTDYDFHFHSVYSDGSWTVPEIIDHAKKIGMKGLALTDHNSIRGVAEFIELCKKEEIIGVTGIEILCKIAGRRIEILGYGFDPENKELLDFLAKIKKNRMKQEKNNVEKLRELGFVIDEKRVEEKKLLGILGKIRLWEIISENPDNFKLISKPERRVFEIEYLKKDGKAPLLNVFNDPKTVIELIHNAGGITSLAHPGFDFPKNEDYKKAIAELANLGLDGIEVYSWKHDEDQTRLYESSAKEYNLITTFGSDDHGRFDAHRAMGKVYVKDPEKHAEILFNKISKP